MPIYEYQCTICGEEFERLVPNSSAQVKCEKCGNEKVTRKLSRFAASVPAENACPAMGNCPSAGGGCGHGGKCCCGGH